MLEKKRRNLRLTKKNSQAVRNLKINPSTKLSYISLQDSFSFFCEKKPRHFVPPIKHQLEYIA